MSLKHLVEDYLEDQPLFRERKNKDRGIVNLLINRYGLHHAIEQGILSKERITAIVQDYASMDRAWRKTLEENATLRGTDYDDKDQLEVKAITALGYNAPRDAGPAPAAEKETQATLL